MKHFSSKLMGYCAAVILMAGYSSCSKSDVSGSDSTTPETESSSKYFVAATIDGFTYVMAVNDLSKDTTITTQYPGTIEHEGTYTQWGYNGTTALFAIEYRQGNPAPGSVFQLSAAGALTQTNDFILDKGFNTIGSFSHYLVAAANNETLTSPYADKTGSVFYAFDLDNDNLITPYQVLAENFIGDQTANFVGVADAGSDNFFTSVMLTATTDEHPVNLDSIYVARIGADMQVQQIYKDDRLSYSGGKFKSARYGQLANDGDGNTYVFSTGYDETTKKSGALRINKGADSFDQDYYFDIESATGGYKLRKVWNIKGDYFLLELYNETDGVTSNTSATHYAIANMQAKTATLITTGFPSIDNITATGWPFTADGKAYIPVVTTSGYPTVYVVDPATAVATKGISISDVTAIPGLGKLTAQSGL
ncbi:protein of unknown function [Arachidicoccus rhizosphaerae]|uniref:DUF4374 domain-containing protein n=1 Tax=Arachidicoccus rhizosphaerae TaxID=551991 RepID=A0A1H3Y4A1_9BACT|nr:DUF4374 domain-containing protein [Arachidicoccus rhizosphaerae]SEA06469.1 protein of unknown function [Arachidicoccus rhizosphaerae]